MLKNDKVFFKMTLLSDPVYLYDVVIVKILENIIY